MICVLHQMDRRKEIENEMLYLFHQTIPQEKRLAIVLFFCFDEVVCEGTYYRGVCRCVCSTIVCSIISING
jgi:hypothetical protein